MSVSTVSGSSLRPTAIEEQRHRLVSLVERDARVGPRDPRAGAAHPFRPLSPDGSCPQVVVREALVPVVGAVKTRAETADRADGPARSADVVAPPRQQQRPLQPLRRIGRAVVVADLLHDRRGNR
jgi:hypothetical protein